MAKDTEKLIRQLSLISFLMAERRPVTALEIKQEVEGYSDMNDEAFARRFYADRAELGELGIELKVEKGTEGYYEAENYSLPPENFYLPPIDESLGRPVLVAGDLMVMFNDRPEVRALMEFFSKGEGVEGWARQGGTLSPHKDSSVDWYPNVIDQKVAQLLLDATSVRFDASDLMPAEVGSGSFWKAMTDYISGSADLDTALSEIDASWPQ